MGRTTLKWSAKLAATQVAKISMLILPSLQEDCAICRERARWMDAVLGSV